MIKNIFDAASALPKYAKLLVLLPLAVFFSCKGVSGKLLIMEGNYHNSGGRFTRAIDSYQKALAHEEAGPYAQAGLGAVYYRLDETKAALARFEDSQMLLDGLSPAGHRELRFRNSYNSGVAYFAQGDFPAAAASFRQALSIDSSRVEAKRNLELSLLSAAQGRNSVAQSAHSSEEDNSRDVIFDYLSRKEQNQWKSREWAAEEQYEGPDY